MIRVAHYDRDNECIDRYLGTYDLETYTRIVLATEITDANWHPEALKAQAVLIRGIGYWHDVNPQWDDVETYGGPLAFPPCVGKPQYYFDVHTDRVAFIPRMAAEKGNQGNRPNDRATETMPEVLLRSNFISAEVFFNHCLQELTDSLADSGVTCNNILLNNIYVPGGPGVAAGCTVESPCDSDDDDHCQYTDLSISTRWYSLADGQESMTNRTSPYGLSGGVSTAEVTPVLTPRPAERYWGHSRMSGTVSNPFGQSGLYIVGPSHGSLIEYRMDFTSI